MTRFIDNNNDFAATIHEQRGNFAVYFGRMNGDYFMPSRTRQSRMYKTQANAMRAINNWISA